MRRDDPSVLTRQETFLGSHAPRMTSARILRIYERLRASKPRLAVDRARLMTESFQATRGQPLVLRWALALEHLAQHLPVSIQPDELIVGRGADFEGRYVLFYPEADGAYAAQAVELMASRPQASVQVTDQDARCVKAMTAHWVGRTYVESYAASLPEQTRHLFFGPDKSNLSLQTYVAMQTATMRNSQNWPRCNTLA